MVGLDPSAEQPAALRSMQNITPRSDSFSEDQGSYTMEAAQWLAQIANGPQM